MSIVEPKAGLSGLVNRVSAILLQPSRTWQEIDGEAATIGGLYKSYVVPLALIPAVCGLIGSAFVGGGVFGLGGQAPILGTLVAQLIGFALTLAGVYVLALIIDALAPTFQGERNRVQAFKVAAYSGTAAWVAGVFQLIPALALLGLLGLYSFYLMFRGLPVLMKAPQEKALVYTAASAAAAIVVWFVVGSIAASVGVIGAGSVASRAPAAGEVSIPGGGQVDLGELEAASKKLEDATRRMEAGGELTDPTQLKAYLPATIAGYGRTELSSSSSGVGEFGGAAATGTYTRGDGRFTLSVVDIGAAGALTALAGAFNMESSSESEGRYEKAGKVDGRLTVEEYDREARRGEYSVLVGERFMVQAQGEGVTMEELKAAVRSIGFAQLETLAQAD
jgi:hypothetical protein